jgi:hypothetical protein
MGYTTSLWLIWKFYFATQVTMVAACTAGGWAAVEMAMGKNPLGITCPNLYPRRKKRPLKTHTYDGYKILSKPIPMRVSGTQRVSHTH